MKLDARWTDDCQGKKDYDSDILSISTRYWPERDYRSIGGKLTKPSATCSLMLWFGENDSKTLREMKFEGDSFEIVKSEVEMWAQEQMDEVVNLLTKHFLNQ